MQKEIDVIKVAELFGDLDCSVETIERRINYLAKEYFNNIEEDAKSAVRNTLFYQRTFFNFKQSCSCGICEKCYTYMEYEIFHELFEADTLDTVDVFGYFKNGTIEDEFYIKENLNRERDLNEVIDFSKFPDSLF
jgi:hypothetical protein